LPYQANRIPTELPANDSGLSQAVSVSKSDSANVVANTAFAEPSGTESATTTSDEGGAETASSVNLSADPQAAQSTRPQRLVTFLNGSVTLDIYQHPYIGNPEAPKVVLEFASYDCSHCHAMHRVLQKALRRYGDQVAIVVLPYPQEMECNKEVKVSSHSITGACAIARMAIGVAKFDPAKFAQFHDWLMAGKDRPPSPAQVVQRAFTLAGRERITDSREQLQKSIAEYIDLFMKIKSQTPDPSKVGLPLLVVGDHIMSGSQESDEKLFQAWEEHLGVRPLNESQAAVPSSETNVLPGI
jgi:protein-disulfide isomerase